MDDGIPRHRIINIKIIEKKKENDNDTQKSVRRAIKIAYNNRRTGSGSNVYSIHSSVILLRVLVFCFCRSPPFSSGNKKSRKIHKPNELDCNSVGSDNNNSNRSSERRRQHEDMCAAAATANSSYERQQHGRAGNRFMHFTQLHRITLKTEYQWRWGGERRRRKGSRRSGRAGDGKKIGEQNPILLDYKSVVLVTTMAVMEPSKQTTSEHRRSQSHIV